MTALAPLVEVRTATEDDLEAMDALLAATDNVPPDVPPMPLGGHVRNLRHLVRRGHVAVAVADGELVGMGAAVTTNRATHLAELSVHPAHQGRGIGGRLFVAAMGDSTRRTTFSSDDPRAMPLYIRGGMLPRWPNLIMTGDGSRLPATSSGTEVVSSSLEDLVRLERAWNAVDRTPEVPYWSGLPEVRPFVVVRGGREVAAGLARDRLRGEGRWMDRAIVAPGEESLEPLIAALRFASIGGTGVGASVPGPNPSVRVLLDAGFRIADRDTFLSSEPDMVDPVRSLVNTGIL